MSRFVWFAIVALFVAGRASASAVIDYSSSPTTTLARCDDCSQQFDLGFTTSFGGSYSKVFVNNNGTLTFDHALPKINDAFPDLFPIVPNGFGQKVGPIIAPFWADVDTSLTGSVIVSKPIIGGHQAFSVTWSDVASFKYPAFFTDTPADGKTNGRNTFQVVLVDRSDLAKGEMNVFFNYDKISWQYGQFLTPTGGVVIPPAEGIDDGSTMEYFNVSGSKSLNQWDGGSLPLIKQTNLRPAKPGRLGFVVGALGASFPIGAQPFVDLDAPPAVPEPATWAMLLGGFGMIGWNLRRRKASITGTSGLRTAGA